MLTDEIKNIEDEENKGNKAVSTPIPIDIPVDGREIPFFNQDTYAGSPKLNIKEKPGFIDTISGAFHDTSIFSTTTDYIKDLYQANPWFDHSDPNFDPSKDQSNFDGLQEKYWGHVLAGKSEKDTKARYFEALRRQEQDNSYKDGSIFPIMLGGFAGAAISPMNWISIASIAKYAKLGTTILESIKASAPALGVSALSYEGYQNALKMKGNVEDFAIDTFIDVIGGLAFMGAGEGLGYGITAAKLFESNKILKHYWRGVEIQPKVKLGGEIEAYKAVPIEGMNASAAHVAEAQNFADSQFAKSGLFYLPVIGGLLGKGATYLNPTLRMHQSRFPIVAAVADRSFDHGLYTEGVLKGKARIVPFAARMSYFKGENAQLILNHKNLYLQSIGIDPSNDAVNTYNLIKQKWQKPDGFMSDEQFDEKIIESILDNTSSKNAAVNEAVEILKPSKDDLWKQWLKINEMPEEILSPATADGHFMRVYNKDALTINADEKWEAMHVEEWNRQDNVIREFTKPIDDLKSRIESLEAAHIELGNRPNRTDIEVKTSAEEIAFNKARLKALEENLQNELRTNEDLRMMVDDIHALSANEAKEIEALTKKQRIAEKEFNERKEIIAKIKAEISSRESSALKSKTVKTLKGNLQKTAIGEHVLAEEEAKLAIAEREFIEESEKLQQLMHEGKIKKILFTKEKGGFKYKFKNPNERLKFRKLFESDHEIISVAKAERNTILNQTAEDTLSNVLGQLVGNSAENPVLRRSIMIPCKVMYANGFLSKDVMANILTYRNAIKRRILIKEIYQDITIDNGIADITNELNRQLHKQESEIRNKTKDQKKQAKEIRKLHKDYEIAVSDLKHTFDLMMGRSSHSKGMREFAEAASAYAVSTRLGGVPMTMISDIGAMPLKHALWPTIRDGAVPFIKTLNGKLKTEASEDFHYNCAQANLGLNHVLMGLRHRSQSGAADPYEPVGGNVANALTNVAHMSNNFFLTNQVENSWQRITANVVQGNIIHYLQQFKNGTLKRRDKEKLLIYGLQPEKWADRMLEQWKLRGKDGNGFGGIQSRFWEWPDVEASNFFAQILHSAVNDTIIRRGPGDAPFLLDNPILKMMFPFKGYLFASINRYLVPTMQRPDAEKLIGMILMMGLGSLVSPLRHLARGEDPFASDENMFMNALRDSSILTLFTETVDNLNLLTNNRILPGMQNDKFRMRSQLGAFGPISQSVADLGNFITAAATFNMNQRDLKAGVNLFPAANAWQFRYLINKGLEASSLPKTYAEAQRG